MMVFCEECGERYIIEDDELTGTAIIFICRVCNEIIRIPAGKLPRQPEGEKQVESEKG
ncbi:MAG: hypothetical protein K4445_01305 [Deltaproteobacteria bacterium]|jgi:RNase P subunit RPR2|nr:hypothetical protein [Syntrophaceae bacterium]